MKPVIDLAVEGLKSGGVPHAETFRVFFEQVYMNERIFDMARQSGATDEKGSRAEHVFCFTKYELKVFAQTIIQDILTVVKSEHKLALEFQWDADDTAIAIRDAIKKRFGVAE